MVLNALTVDLEDWFQVSNLERVIGRENWDRCEQRLEASTYRLLALLDEAEVKATFFVLGWNAERYPGLVREIWRRGHEIGIHGYRHALVYEQTPVQFAWEINRCVQLVGEITGEQPVGHRAASFSLVPRTLWALEVLREQGIGYDSSIFPVRHHRYGLPHSPRHPYRITMGGKPALVEFPVSTLSLWGQNLGFSGGAYLRLLPYWVVAAGISRLNRQGQPAVVYLHPWDLDTGQPRQKLNPWLYLRCYGNLEQTEPKLQNLLADFEFAPMREVLAGQAERLPSFSLEQANGWALGREGQPGYSPQTT